MGTIQIFADVGTHWRSRQKVVIRGSVEIKVVATRRGAGERVAEFLRERRVPVVKFDLYPGMSKK